MQIRMLGPFEVRTGAGVPVEVAGARLRGLLVALALQTGRPVPKAMLVDWIWGEYPPADAANALQRLVSRLRRALPDGTIEGQPEGYRLTVPADAVDAVRFEQLIGQARSCVGTARLDLLRDALDLWRGAAMQDVGLQESAALDAAVTRLEELRLSALEERFDAELEFGHGAESITELSDLVAAHPLREGLVAALMRAQVAAGRDSEALQLFQRTREALADAFGVDPSPELSALHVALLRGELGRREETRKTNLRAELTSFVGKDDDVAAVRALIAEHRLTTLIGPGGAGKTRLATETARTLTDQSPDGVWLIEFAPIDANGDVAQTTLSGLGLRDALLAPTPSPDATEGLISALRDRELVLILDNCEHVIEPVARLAARLLGECRKLRILATSREPLGITGEALWQVEPLALPAGADSAQVAASPAVRLLRDRASAVRKDLGTDPATLATMARICRALDGVPFAIELAAARLRTMTLDQLADRLDDRFRLLTGGSRTALPRQRTLRAMVDWSWELLTDAERRVLRRLSVFSGGAGLEAAEHVCAGAYRDEERPIDPDQMLELLTSLTEKSLLITRSDAAPRFRMLTTIREYGAERLAEAGEADSARRAHLEHFTRLAETAEPHLRRARQLDWMAVLRADHDNLSSALRGAIAAGDALGATRLAAASGWYWWLGGRRGEGLELLTAAAGLPGDVPDDVRAMAYGMVVLFVTSGVGDEQVGAEWIRKGARLRPETRSSNPLLGFAKPLLSLLEAPDRAVVEFAELAEESPDPWVRAMGRWQSAKLRTVFGQDGPDEEAELSRALAQFEALGERFGLFLSLSELAAHLARHGDFARACGYLDRAVLALTEVGTVEDVIELRTQQAQYFWLAGRREDSAAALAEAERLAESVTWPYTRIFLGLAKAKLAQLAGDLEQARREFGRATALLDGALAEQAHLRSQLHDLQAYLAEDLGEARSHRMAALRAATEGGWPAMIAVMLVGVADLALRLGDADQAARLVAASIAVRGYLDRSQADAVRIEQQVRELLGEARFGELSEEGARADWSELAEATLAT